MKTRVWLAVAVATMVAGCGGNGEGDTTASTEAQPAARAMQVLPQVVASADLVFDPAAAAPVTTDVEISALTGAGNSHVALDRNGNGLLLYVRAFAPPLPELPLPLLFGRSIDASGEMGPERKLGGYAGPVRDLRVKFDADGSAAIVWVESIGPAVTAGPSRVMLASYSAGAWYGPEAVSVPPPPPVAQYTEVERPDVAFSPDGQWAFLAWTERTKGLGSAPDTFRTMTASATAHGNVGWESTTPVYELGTAFRDRNARIAVLPDNSRVVVVREQGQPGGAHQLVFYRAGPDKPWGPGNLLPGQEPSYYLQNWPAGEVMDFDLAANATGQVTVVWRHAFPGTEGRQAEFATRLQPSGAWSNPLLVDVGALESASDHSVGRNSTEPRVVVDGEGNALFAWRQQDAVGSPVFSLYAARFDAAVGGFEGRPRVLESRPQRTLGAPALAIDADGRGVVSWLQDTSPDEQFVYSLFARRFDGAGKNFGAPALVEADDSDTVVGSSQGVAFAAPDGRVLALWMQGGRVMFNRSR